MNICSWQFCDQTIFLKRHYIILLNGLDQLIESFTLLVYLQEFTDAINNSDYTAAFVWSARG